MNARTLLVAAALTPALGVMTAAAQDPNVIPRRDSACIGQDSAQSGLNDTLRTQRGPADSVGGNEANRGNLPNGQMDGDSLGAAGDSLGAGADSLSGCLPRDTSSTGISNETEPSVAPAPSGQIGGDTANGVPANPPSTSGNMGGAPTTNDTTVHNPVPDYPTPTDPRPTPDPNTPSPPAPTPGSGLPGTPSQGSP